MVQSKQFYKVIDSYFGLRLQKHYVALRYCLTENRANEERLYYNTNSEETNQNASSGAASSPIGDNVYSLADNQYSLAGGDPSNQEPEVYTLAESFRQSG